MPPPPPDEVSARLRAASRLSDLLPEKRLDAKIDMSPAGLSSRLRQASDLLDLCRALGALGRRND